MQNIKVEKRGHGVGYFLTIGETKNVRYTWAVSASELLTLLTILRDMEEELMKEIEGNI